MVIETYLTVFPVGKAPRQFRMSLLSMFVTPCPSIWIPCNGNVLTVRVKGILTVKGYACQLLAGYKVLRLSDRPAEHRPFP